LIEEKFQAPQELQSNADWRIHWDANFKITAVRSGHVTSF
jgi:hypothetical protein